MVFVNYLALDAWHFITSADSEAPTKTSGYFRHTDNSSGNGRLLTALIYLNDGLSPQKAEQWMC